jgi:hypothetical protein
MRGLPDWGQPADAGAVTGYLGHETGRLLVLPDALVLAQGPDGQPEFRLSAVRPMVPTPGQQGHGQLEMALALRSGAASPDGLVQAVPALRGWLVLSAEALDLPDELRAPIDLRCSGTGAADLSLPLHPEGVAFIERVLVEGALPVLARADLEIAGVARRVAGRITVDHAALSAAVLAGLAPQDLRAGLERDPSAMGVRIDSDDPFAVEAAVDHLRAQLCGGPMRPGPDGLLLVWDGAVPTTGRSVLDLSTAVMATRQTQLLLDPFAAARRLAGQGALVHRVTTAPLQAGQHRVSLGANLPRPLAGPLSVGARLVIPPRPPVRMHEIREDVEFADNAPVSRVLRLAPNESLAWRVEGTVWLPTPDGRGAALTVGPMIEGTGPEIELRPHDFPLGFVRIAASAALLAVASVGVTLRSEGLTARAVLTSAAPETALALPGTGVISARIFTPEGQVLDLPTQPARDWRIELADLPGYGPRATEITVGFPPDLPLRALDLRVGGGAVQTLAFTPARPTRRFDWFCPDPFRPALAWRWHDQPSADFLPVTGDRLDLNANEGEVA